MISIRSLLNSYAGGLKKNLGPHDRSKTVGASEIGQCARKTWFSKNRAARDEGYVDGWGAQLRGTVMEEAFWEPGLRATLPEGVRLLYAGKEQKTLTRGWLSATTDGLMVWPDGYCVNLDCKSIDPRANLSKEKSEHFFQVQTQAGLIRELTEFKPDISIISYIDASFWDRIEEFTVPFDPKIYANAHVRAERIMTERDSIGLPPEGKLAGGDECKYCAWASHCAEVTVAGIPRDTHELDEPLAHKLMLMRDRAVDLRQQRDDATTAYDHEVEEIKEFMRTQNTRAYRGDGWSVSYSAVNGRATLDTQAVKDAGIDLAPYYKTGNSSERLVLK